MPVDADGDRQNEVALVAHGKLSVREHTDIAIWSTPFLGIGGIAGVSDLNGDGALEIVATAQDRVYVFDLQTGTLRWEQPGGDFGTLGGVRLADLDGDGRDELFVQECACCAITNGKTGFAYSFVGGFRRR